MRCIRQTSQRARIKGGEVGKGDARADGYASAKTLNMRADSMLIRIRMWLTCSLFDPKGNTNGEVGPSSIVQDAQQRGTRCLQMNYACHGKILSS